MDYFPAFLNLKQKNCLVVGGGTVAARKIELLQKCHARVQVVAPELGDAARLLLEEQAFEWHPRVFQTEDLTRAFLVICATSDHQINQQVARLAEAQGTLVNVVDSPSLCNFIVPAIIDRSPVITAISSGGASPVLARLVKSRVETLLSPAIASMGHVAREFREKVRLHINSAAQRRRFWEEHLQGRFSQLMIAGRDSEARAHLEQAIAEASTHPDAASPLPFSGLVSLVGAGPGDPDLLTFKALRLMQEADVVVYDRLVSDSVMQLVRRDAERIYVGKASSNHSKSQHEINEILIRQAQAGKKVVRLKGGDPFIFGRGGEEIETLQEQGIPFQVVPGITAASGCASYAGIPLTHRDHAQYCTFVTGHLRDGNVSLPWENLARPHQTLVIYMGLMSFASVSEELIRHGCPESLPAALVRSGTTPDQQVITGTLKTLPELIEQAAVKSPALIIVGTVVTLREKLAWYGTQP